ncbi:glycoside hydrolase family 35 protein [Lederbergia galactosidilytica]|uniref:beta-galactosidase n=1 Tax=Lederbergia galactosidilytica TaxID=217031 RepID=A0A178A6K9_9BACI|nr:beta-galactosidase family protein [Lederbergia galactosidilytica]KRG15434.1 beta-galactosidase [Virgibacillus soli]OAK75846.1 beta-galactosidase [Lederbergia galactosidilytica]
MPKLTYNEKTFLLDGKEIQLLSGAMHYFRTVPEYWEDRLRKLKAAGLNTVETYVAWNIHEPEEGQFQFEGIADIVKFVKTAEKVGLHVIVRPGPYICAEWEFGGFPYWLMTVPNIKLRCFNQPYLDKVDRYFDVLFEKLNPLLSANGGPIIALQIENEYGSFGNDKQYLEYMRDGLKKRAGDMFLFTSDGPTHSMFSGGMIDGVFETANFGSRGYDAFNILKEYQPKGPGMCMEFWHGWFDHWGEEHHTRSAASVVESLEEILEQNGSVNFYMGHGGTNFAFYNGANHNEEIYQPTITSYDYDALLTESGEVTEKLYQVRKAFEKYVDLPEMVLPDPLPKKAYGKVVLNEKAELLASLEQLSQPQYSAAPLTMEEYGQGYGFIVYETTIKGAYGKQNLTVQDVHDRGQVYLNGEFVGLVDRISGKSTLEVDITEKETKVQIIVENMGRINYGPFLVDFKGVTEGVRLGNQFLFDWTVYPLPLTDLSKLTFSNQTAKEEHPYFHRGTLHIEEVADTFIDVSEWKKGVVFVNGHNLGRYWEIGPQQTLYVPAPFLQEGENEIILLELHHHEKEVIFKDTPNLG